MQTGTRVRLLDDELRRLLPAGSLGTVVGEEKWLSFDLLIVEFDARKDSVCPRDWIERHRLEAVVV